MQNGFVQEYRDWLTSLGADTDGHGSISSVWHQNDALVRVVSVEGAGMIFSGVTAAVQTNNGQTCYIATTATPNGDGVLDTVISIDDDWSLTLRAARGGSLSPHTPG